VCNPGRLRTATKRQGSAGQSATRRGLFFYDSGHGNEDAIVPADYKRGVRNALSVGSLLASFQGTQFPEQYFFFDCCRNLFRLAEEERLDAFEPKAPRRGIREGSASDETVFVSVGRALGSSLLDAAGDVAGDVARASQLLAESGRAVLGDSLATLGPGLAPLAGGAWRSLTRSGRSLSPGRPAPAFPG